jgi:hypothetical protein
MNEDWNVEDWNFDDDDSSAADDTSTDFDFDEESVVTIQLAENEECPVCQSKHCLQNYGNRWLFLCLDCFHQFYNS